MLSARVSRARRASEEAQVQGGDRREADDPCRPVRAPPARDSVFDNNYDDINDNDDDIDDDVHESFLFNARALVHDGQWGDIVWRCRTELPGRCAIVGRDLL
jgi:hypothetical protein